MSLPPDGRKPLSFKFHSTASTRQSDSTVADQKDSKARLRLERPSQLNVFKSPSLPPPTQPLTTRTTTVVSTISIQLQVNQPTSSSSSSSVEAAQHQAGSESSESTQASSPTHTSNVKSPNAGESDDGGTRVNEEDTAAVLRLSSLREPTPTHFRRFELRRVAGDHFSESIRVCIPQGGPNDPEISQGGAEHIILGDFYGTGHLGSVAERTDYKPVNTRFPKHWSADKILLVVWQLAKIERDRLSLEERQADSLREYVCSADEIPIKIVMVMRTVITAYPISLRIVREAETQYERERVPRAPGPRLIPTIKDVQLTKGKDSKK